MKYLLLIMLSFGCAQLSFAQHEHHAPADTNKSTPDTAMHSHDEMHHEMSSAFSPNLSMNRDGSGTSWQPDANPMMMYSKMLGTGEKGMTHLMVHGNIFLRYMGAGISTQSEWDDEDFNAPNMMMLMLSHTRSSNVFSFISMFSLDPFTVGEAGYPLLFQTGESYKGRPLVDRQHPHDLFAELAVNYTHAFSEDVDVNVYGGYPAEPALGPVMFMHRLSSMNNPDAPLGHHWQDATHITFGVGTLGLRYKEVKVEGSLFTGREPDENRYDFDEPTFDSYSFRLNANPSPNLALQLSHGLIKSPELLHPDDDVRRTTASLLHTVRMNDHSFVSSALVWGQNVAHGDALNSYLLESNLTLNRFSVYGRYELVQKSAEEFNFYECIPEGACSNYFEENLVFDINAITLGVNRVLFTRLNSDLSLGLQGTVNFPDNQLDPLYGTAPLSAQIYLKLAPKVVF